MSRHPDRSHCAPKSPVCAVFRAQGWSSNDVAEGPAVLFQSPCFLICLKVHSSHSVANGAKMGTHFRAVLRKSRSFAALRMTACYDGFFQLLLLRWRLLGRFCNRIRDLDEHHAQIKKSIL